jgi:hypothetical protein
MVSTAAAPANESITEMMEHGLSPEDATYRESVEALAVSGSSDRFSNGAPIHAAIIFDVFFRHAKRSVKIFCQNLAENVFSCPLILKSAKEAVARGVSISVITQKKADETVFSEWLKSLPNVFFIENASKKDPRIRMLNSNFAVMDSTAYRYEENAAKIHAVACMNDRNTARKLEGLFALIAPSEIGA